MKSFAITALVLLTWAFPTRNCICQTVDYVSLISGNGNVGSFTQPVSDIAVTGNTVVGLGLDGQTVDYVSLISGNGNVDSFTQPVSDIAASGNLVVGVNVTPEPSTLALLGAAAIGFVGYALRRRKQRCSRSIAEESDEVGTDLQEEGPAILTMPSVWTVAARRAA